MQYTQSKDESARLLKLALIKSGSHEAPFTPATFAVWYEHLAGINRGLSLELEGLLAGGAKLDHDTMMALFRSHIADDGANPNAEFGEHVQQLLQDIEQVTQRTGEKARSYELKLNDLGESMTQGSEAARFNGLLAEAVGATHDMQGSVQALSKAVTAGEAEIRRLRRDLERANIEVLTDPLTRVLNRKGFDEALQRLVAKAPAPSTLHCLVLLDVDHFKRINDTHGHLAGDAVLVALAEVIARASQAPGSQCARYGGEEFAILLESTTLAHVRGVTAAVCKLIRELRVGPTVAGDFISGVTVSGGIGRLNAGSSGEALVAAADKALYYSKRNGRNRVTIA